MTRVIPRVAVVLCGLALTWSDPVAQTVQRPRLRSDEDTNDASAYIRRARSLLYNSSDSAQAAAEAALFWAGRLDPTSSDVPYLLTVALIRPIIVKARQEGGLSGKRLRKELTPARIHRIDSLMREAWLREPFVNLDLEPMLCLNLVAPGLVRDPATKGYFAYQFKDYGLALDSWGKALARDSFRLDLRFHRAHTFHRAAEYDSAVAELHAALALVTQSDSGLELIVSPTYVLNYALGTAFERLGRVDSAKVAFRRSLTENLGLYMAHVRLSSLLLFEGDTAQALVEISLAAGVAPRDPVVASYYAFQLIAARRFAEATEQVRRAIAIDSVYATLYLLMGLAEQGVGRDSAALANLDTFLQRAPRSDSRREWVAQRIAALRTKPDD
jgi:tetratricopeptide (TPR) repeat protein